jgi:outer membrane protein W
MKRVGILFLLVSLLGFNNASSQDYHRLSNGEPYDIFYSVKPLAFKTFGDFTKNYIWGAGFSASIEYQFQEVKIGVGAELGFSYVKGTSYKIEFLPRKFVKDAQQVPFTLYANYYFHNEESYYSFWDRLKPYAGIGFGAIWGLYDYSLSNDANKSDDSFGYYLRDYEGQSGFRVGLIPRVGLMVAMDHHAIGFEASFQHYFSLGRLEKQQQYSIALTYTYIIQ